MLASLRNWNKGALKNLICIQGKEPGLSNAEKGKEESLSE